MILGGTNDLGGNNASKIFANLLLMYEKVRAHGAVLVVVTVPPSAHVRLIFLLMKMHILVN